MELKIVEVLTKIITVGITLAIYIFLLGFPVGTVITMPLSGLIADSFGWEYVYYFFGAIAMAFAILWIALAHDSPKDHHRMNKAFIFKG